MNKLKALFFFVMGIILVVFAYENTQPAPTIRFFGDIVTLPTDAIIYAPLAVGFVLGWMAHALRAMRKKRAAAQAAQSGPQPASPPAAQETS